MPFWVFQFRFFLLAHISVIVQITAKVNNIIGLLPSNSVTCNCRCVYGHFTDHHVLGLVLDKPPAPRACLLYEARTLRSTVRVYICAQLSSDVLSLFISFIENTCFTQLVREMNENAPKQGCK